MIASSTPQPWRHCSNSLDHECVGPTHICVRSLSHSHSLPIILFAHVLPRSPVPSLRHSLRSLQLLYALHSCPSPQASYVNSLHALVNAFFIPLKEFSEEKAKGKKARAKDTISPSELGVIFNNIEEILGLNEEFMAKLKVGRRRREGERERERERERDREIERTREK